MWSCVRDFCLPSIKVSWGDNAYFSCIIVTFSDELLCYITGFHASAHCNSTHCCSHDSIIVIFSYCWRFMWSSSIEKMINLNNLQSHPQFCLKPSTSSKNISQSIQFSILETFCTLARHVLWCPLLGLLKIISHPLELPTLTFLVNLPLAFRQSLKNESLQTNLSCL